MNYIPALETTNFNRFNPCFKYKLKTVLILRVDKEKK